MYSLVSLVLAVMVFLLPVLKSAFHYSHSVISQEGCWSFLTKFSKILSLFIPTAWAVWGTLFLFFPHLTSPEIWRTLKLLCFWNFPIRKLKRSSERKYVLFPPGASFVCHKVVSPHLFAAFFIAHVLVRRLILCTYLLPLQWRIILKWHMTDTVVTCLAFPNQVTNVCLSVEPFLSYSLLSSLILNRDTTKVGFFQSNEESCKFQKRHKELCYKKNFWSLGDI